MRKFFRRLSKRLRYRAALALLHDMPATAWVGRAELVGPNYARYRGWCLGRMDVSNRLHFQALDNIAWQYVTSEDYPK